MMELLCEGGPYKPAPLYKPLGQQEAFKWASDFRIKDLSFIQCTICMRTHFINIFLLHNAADSLSRLWPCVLWILCICMIWNIKAFHAIRDKCSVSSAHTSPPNLVLCQRFYSLQRVEVWFFSCCLVSLNKSTTCIKVTSATAASLLNADPLNADWNSVLEYRSGAL